MLDVDSLDFNLGERRSYISEASVADAARAFLSSHADVLGIHPKSLIGARVTTNGRLWFISYGQDYKGVRVLNSETGITIDYSGKLVALGVEAFPDVEVTTTPFLEAATAVQATRGSNTPLGAELVEKPTLAIFPVEQADRYDYHLVWKFRLDDLDAREEPFSASFLVDAHTGEVLAAYNNILTHSQHGHYIAPSRTATGVAPSDLPAPYAHMPDASDSTLQPVFASAGSAANSVYGYVKLSYYETPEDFTDPLIRHTDQAFKGAKVRVTNLQTFQELTTYADDNGYYSISGLSTGSHNVKFEIANDKAYINSGVAPTIKTFTVNINGAIQQDYDWNWGDDGDGGKTSYALNGVYHVREMYNYITDTYGYSDMDDVTMRFYIQSSGQGEIIGGNRIYLGGAEAMSSEVTLHEYAHGVFYNIYDGSIASGQTDTTKLESEAMDEGFADYFSADKTNDHTFGGPQANSDPAAPVNDGVTVRFLYNNAMNDCTMNEFFGSSGCGGELHKRGKIISGAIWRIRDAIGSDASDLLFDALQISPLPETFEELRARYVAADNAANSGANGATIEQKFTDRYIGGPVAPTSPYITLDGSDFPVIHWTDNSTVEDGYKVERKLNAGSWSVVSTESVNEESFTDSYRCLGGGSGTYHYRIQGYYENSGHDDEVTYSSTTSLSLDTCDSSGAKMASDDSGVEAEEIVPAITDLEAAYPNPFNPQTILRYTLAEEGLVQLSVYDVLGRKVAVLVNESQQAGAHEVEFDAQRLPSGIYIYRLKAGDRHFSQTMLLTK